MIDKMTLEELEELLVEVQLDIMDETILQKKQQGKMVFGEVQNGLLN